MAEVNANIPLSTIAPPIMQPGQQLQLMEVARQMKLRNDVQNLMRTPGALDEQGLPKTQTLIALRQIDQAMGDQATMHRATVLAEQDLARKRAIDAQRDLEKARTEDIADNIMAPSLNKYYSTPGDETARSQAYKDSIINTYNEWKKTGKANQYQMAEPKFLDALLAHSPDDVASILIAKGKGAAVEGAQARRAATTRVGAGPGGVSGAVAEASPNATGQATPAQPEPSLEETLQTDTKSGAQYRGLPDRGMQGVPLAEVGKTPQQDQATGQEGPTLKDPNVLTTTGGEPVLEVNVEGNRLAQGWLDRARDLEKQAEAVDADPSLGKPGREQSKELRKEANDLRTRALTAMKEDRLEQKTDKQQSLTPMMKEAAAVYGEGTPKYKKAIEDHIKKMDTLPQWLAQAPSPMTADQAKLTGEDFLATLSPGEQATVKGVANLTIDPNSISTRNNQRQAILEKVTKYKPDYNQQDFKESQNAAVRFGSGPQGNAVRSFNVALEHLETLKDAAAAMGSGDVQRINQIRNAWRRETGSDLPTNFEAVKQIISAEVVKAIVGGGTAGALADREEAARQMIAQSSPTQILGVINRLQSLFGGQIHGLEQQYKAATKRGDFRERYLTPIGQKSAAAADADIGKTPDMRGVGGKSRTQSKEREFSGEQQPIPQFSKEEIDAEMKRRGLQ